MTNKDTKIKYDKDSQVKINVIVGKGIDLNGDEVVKVQTLIPTEPINLGSVKNPKFEIHSIEIQDTTPINKRKWFDSF